MRVIYFVLFDITAAAVKCEQIILLANNKCDVLPS